MPSRSSFVPFLFTFLLYVDANQLFYPMEQMKEDDWCGPFKQCPEGTQCMRLADRPEPFSCFLPRFGSTISFIEQLERPIVSRLTPPQLQHYEPLPVWMLASAAFGVLCAASIVVWLTFFVCRHLIIFTMRVNCQHEDKRKAESTNLGFRRESGDLNAV